MIANAVASKVALNQAEQTIKDLVIRASVPKLLPPSLMGTSTLSYGVTRRQVSEGQMIKEGEAVVELVIEDPIRLWSQVPEQYSEDVRVGQRVRLSTRAHPGLAIEGKVRGSTLRSTRRAARFRSRHWFPTSAGCCGPAVSPRLRSSPIPTRRPPWYPSTRSSSSPASPSSSSSRAARRERSMTSRPAPRDEGGSRSRASNFPGLPRWSSPGRPSLPMEPRLSSANPSPPPLPRTPPNRRFRKPPPAPESLRDSTLVKITCLIFE